MIDRSLLRVAPEAFFVILGQVVAAGGSIFAIRVLTTLLRPAAYGELALALTGAVLAQQLILGPIGTACERHFAPSAENRELGIYTRSILTLFASGTLALAAISISLGTVLWATGHRPWLSILAPAFAYAWISSASSMLDGIQNAARQRIIVAAHQGSGAWLRLGIVIALAKLMHIDSNCILWSFAAGYLLLICSQLFFLVRTLRRLGYEAPAKGTSVRPMLKSMCRYTWPFSAWGIFTWIQSSSDRWALGAYTGLYQVGLYQSLYQVGYYPISMLTQFLLQVCTPIVFQRAGSGTDAKRRLVAEKLNNTLTWVVLLATGIAGILSALGGHRLLALVLAPGYRSHSGLISIFILASGCFAAGQIKSLNFMTSFSTQRLIAPKVVTAAVGTGLIVIGAFYRGSNGVAAAQLAFSALYLSWIFLLDRKHSTIGSVVAEVA
jgi:O-antigen/teichoic acid export membrane protein